MRLVLLGPPGAGKGTQAQKLSKGFGLVHLSTGDLLRKAVNEGNSLGQRAKSFMNKGELVPDSIILELLESEIEKKDNFILDGFPRNLTQAEKLSEVLQQKGKKLDLVINLEVDEATIIKRLTRRMICPKCGKIYHIDEIGPEKICQRCGVKLYQRSDDDEKVIKNRFQVYLKHTRPLIEYYKRKGILYQISGKGSPEEISERIKTTILPQMNTDRFKCQITDIILRSSYEV